MFHYITADPIKCIFLGFWIGILVEYIADKLITIINRKLDESSAIEESSSTNQDKVIPFSKLRFDHRYYPYFDTEIFKLICFNQSIEPGESSRGEEFLKPYIKDYESETIILLSRLYFDSGPNIAIHSITKIKLGILAVFSHIDTYNSRSLSTAKLALEEDNEELQEYGIRCIENWECKEGIQYLKEMLTPSPWLNEYRLGVIQDLEESN